VNSVPTLNRFRTSSARRKCWSWALGFCVLVTALVAAESVSETDRQAAINIASQTPWVSVKTFGNTPHPLGRQTLFIEPNIRKGRTTDQEYRVYEFDYTLATARVLVVDIKEQQLISEHSIDSVHLPMNGPETQSALTALENNTAMMDELRRDQIRRGQTPFDDFNELSVKAIVYVPMVDTDTCQNERCALLSLFDRHNTVFSMEPVVNLQTGQIRWLDR